jgi:hypothetical protein
MTEKQPNNDTKPLTNAKKAKAFKARQAEKELVQLNVWVHKSRKDALKKMEKEWQKPL